jgi:hypothetical protein
MGCTTLCQACLSFEQSFGVLFLIQAPSPWRTVRAAGRVPMLHDVRCHPPASRSSAVPTRLPQGCPPASDQPRIPIPETRHWAPPEESSFRCPRLSVRSTRLLLRGTRQTDVAIFGADIKTTGTASLLVSLPTVAVGVLRYRAVGGYAAPGSMRHVGLPMARSLFASGELDICTLCT